MKKAHPKRPLESQRIALHRKIVLRFPDFDGFVTEYSANLSMTGMFVRSLDPHPPGTPVSFEFKLTDGLELIKGTGWVVWVREKDDGPELPAGMGIEFSEVSADSRRLIRWVVLHQLPEGVAPFELSNYDNRGAFVATAPPRLGTPGRSIGLGIAAAILLFALGAGALLLLRPSAGQAQSEVAGKLEQEIAEPEARPSEEPRVATEAAGPARSELAAAPEEGSSEQALDPYAVASEVEGVVRDWATSWSNQDPAAYLEFYADDFVPPSGLSRAAWEAQRYERLTGPQRILVALTSMETEVFDRRAARVSFTQTYRSNSFSDMVRKTLVLRRTSEGWRILREEAAAV